MRDTRAVQRAIVLCGLGLVAGCYASHELRDGGAGTDASRDTGSACLAPGTYDVVIAIRDDDPADCFGGPAATTVPVHVPPIADDYRGMCGAEAVSIVPTDVPCTWEIVADCPAADASTRVSGTFSAPSRGVAGRFDVEQGSLFGVCRFSMTFEPAP